MRTTVAKELILAVLLGAMAQAQQAAPVSKAIADEVSMVRPGTTPGEWQAEHPSEKIEIYNGPALVNDTHTWCARAVVQRESGGRTWTRAVYFYDPKPPADDALPPAGMPAPRVRETMCRLGMEWIEVPESDGEAGAKLAGEVEGALGSRYGAGETPKMAEGFGSAGWVGVKQWRVGDGLLTVAYDQLGGKGRRMLARLAYPNSDAIHDLAREMEESRAEHASEREAIVERVREAQLPGGPTSAMVSLLENHDYFSGTGLPSEVQVVDAFRGWLGAAAEAGAAQRAMALLAADRVLDFLDHNGVPLGDSGRAQMKALGAEYVNNELAGGLVYAHSLLKRAAAIAPAGPVSDQVLLLEMERGFDESGMCSAGAEEFSPVIQKGEGLLAIARSLPTSTLASVHFMVADAYATIVWLAKPSNSDYHDPKQYQAAAPNAREKALEHYREAFQVEHGTMRAQKAWTTAFRLAAGLAPSEARYFCVYD